MVVRSELERIGIPYKVVELGEAELTDNISPDQRDQLNLLLKKSGLELMDDKKSMLIEKIKTVIIELVQGTAQDKIFRIPE